LTVAVATAAWERASFGSKLDQRAGGWKAEEKNRRKVGKYR
jgi:hypothetical protein